VRFPPEALLVAGFGHVWPHPAEHLTCTTESVVPPSVDLCNIQKLKLAKARVSALVHGGGEQELESLSDFGRLGIKERG